MRRKRRSDPDAPLRGEVSVPGDKSISHRALILAALARGSSRISNINVGADVQATARILEQLGADVELDQDYTEARVEGVGWSGLSEPTEVLDAGNSGTTMRCLLGVCAAIEGFCVLTGDASLRSRPMLRVVGPLRQMGASVDGREHGDKPPLVVRGGDLTGLDFVLPVASAQVKTALLLAGLSASGVTAIVEPARTRDHTERMLVAAGVELTRSGMEVSVKGGQELQALPWDVPGDISSAAFFIAAAALLDGSELVVTEVGLNPTRTAFLGVLERMGARIEVVEEETRSGEPRGRVRVLYSELDATEIAPEEVPALIDELPLLTVLATQARGTTRINGAQELRLKESDRIDALATGLRDLGATVEVFPDGLSVQGPVKLRGGQVDSRLDHRVALAFAVGGLVAEDNVRIAGWSSISTSFPEFLDVLGAARGQL